MRVIAGRTERGFTDEAPGAAARRSRRPTDRFAGLPIAQAALGFASARHAAQYREIDRAPSIAHPVEVGWLLLRDGQPDKVIAAGLLHDLLEKTATTSPELRRLFGALIARLVESVSDDPSIVKYEPRKRELRDRHRARRPRHACDLRRGQDLQSPGTGTDTNMATPRRKDPRKARSLPRQRRHAPASCRRPRAGRLSRRRAQPARRSLSHRSSPRQADQEHHRIERSKHVEIHDLKAVPRTGGSSQPASQR